jgi:hypothetical protein
MQAVNSKGKKPGSSYWCAIQLVRHDTMIQRKQPSEGANNLRPMPVREVPTELPSMDGTRMKFIMHKTKGEGQPRGTKPIRFTQVNVAF